MPFIKIYVGGLGGPFIGTALLRDRMFLPLLGGGSCSSISLTAVYYLFKGVVSMAEFGIIFTFDN